jgi:hypothetical protein
MRLIGRAAVRPHLIPLMLRAGWRFRARGWWRRPPFLPLPPAEYLAWRLHTAYGETGATPEFAEFERYLRWVVRMNRAHGGA